MHPTNAFHWSDRAEMLEFVREHAFAHIFAASEAGPFVVHAPVLVKDGRIWFHVSRRNRIAEVLDGSRAVVSITGREAYHSANWYASANQVPTWHYEAVEIEGAVRRLSEDELVELLDLLSAQMEMVFSPEGPWTRGKMEPGKFEALTRALAGFEVDPADIRGTRKFNQHKKGEDLAATIEGQRRAGREDIVDAIEELVPRGE
jgi:transcriptional regulator